MGIRYENPTVGKDARPAVRSVILTRAHTPLPAICLFLLAILLIPAPPARAISLPPQQPLPGILPHSFDRLTTEDGLSQNTVTAILQDSRGFMWFGTENGLNRYDGYSFTVYKHDPDDADSLRDDSIMTLYEDSWGVIWIGTQSGWLERLDPDPAQEQGARFDHYQFPTPVLSLYEDHLGTFWVGTWGVLYHLDRDSGESSTAMSSTDSAIVHAMIETEDDSFWLGSNDGWLHILDRNAGRFRPVPVSVPIENYSVTVILSTRAGLLWIGREGGGFSRLARDEGENQFIHYRHDPEDPNSLIDDAVSALYQDHAGALWIGTRGGGLDHFDPLTGRFTHYQHLPGDAHSLSDDTVISLYEDHSGMLWIGTVGGGVNKLDLVQGGSNHYRSIAGDKDSLSDNVVLAVQQDREGRLWIGTASGLNRYDRESGEWRHYSHNPVDRASLSHDLVWSLFEDSEGTLWIGTNAGLDRYVPATDRFVRHVRPRPSLDSEANAVQAIGSGSEGTLWLADSSGLYRFHPDSGHFEHLMALETSLSWEFFQRGYNWRVTALEDLNGSVWFGTPGDGLFRLDGEDLLLYQADIDDAQSLSSDLITALFEDSEGRLWVGTSGGLDRFEPETGSFVHYRAKDGLPDNEMRGILQAGDDSPVLWVSTAGGLARFDPARGTFENYEVTNALQSDEFNASAAYAGASGELFFGGMNGLHAFYPDQLNANPHIPPVVITELGLHDQMVRTDLAPGEQIELSYRDNSVSFGFAALDYHAPEKNQYAYRMEGLDQDWVQAGTRRYVEYRDLAPGDYVFRVKAANNSGVWNQEGATVRISIEPPFWENWWFRSVVAALLIIAGLGFVWLRTRSLETRSRVLEEQVDVRTAELQQEIGQRLELEEALGQSEREKAIVDERNRLARDLHDSVTQSLYAMTLYSDAATRSLSTGRIESAAESLGKLRRTAKEALGETRLILFGLRPPILEREGLPGALRTRLETVEHRSGLKTEFYLEGEGQPPPEIEEELYRIVLEVLNNALKHASACTIRLALCLDSRQVALTISDDGVGFDPADSDEGGLGLRNMAERAAEIGAELSLESTPGSGTIIRVAWAGDETPRTDDPCCPLPKELSENSLQSPVSGALPALGAEG